MVARSGDAEPPARKRFICIMKHALLQKAAVQCGFVESLLECLDAGFPLVPACPSVPLPNAIVGDEAVKLLRPRHRQRSGAKSNGDRRPVFTSRLEGMLNGLNSPLGQSCFCKLSQWHGEPKLKQLQGMCKVRLELT